MILYSLLRFPNFSLYVLEFGLSPVPRSSKESPVLYQIQSCLGQPCREGSCTSELWQFYSYMCLFKPFVAFQRLLWQSIVLLLGIGYTFRQGFVPDHQKKKKLVLLVYENLPFSVQTFGWLLYLSGGTPSPGCWLVWWGWSDAWSGGSVWLCLHRNKACQMCVSHLVFVTLAS